MQFRIKRQAGSMHGMRLLSSEEALTVHGRGCAEVDELRPDGRVWAHVGRLHAAARTQGPSGKANGILQRDTCWNNPMHMLPLRGAPPALHDVDRILHKLREGPLV